MGKNVSKNSPQKNQQAAETSSPNAELIARIDQLEKMLIHTRKKRIGQSIVVWSCAAILIAVCAWFLMTFYNLYSNYDMKLLARELQNNSGIVIESPEFQSMLLDARKIFLPAYRKALTEELSAQAPDLSAKAEKELTNLKELLVKRIKRTFVKEIQKDFKKVEKDLLKRYPDLNADKLNEAYEKASVLFADKLTVSLNNYVNQAINKLTELDETFRQFKKGDAYKALNKKSVQEVENLLVESMLELWIYELNPDKGARLVEVEVKKSAKRGK
jgi:hypothetical protein